jgi:hypothetical protein
MSEFEIPKNNYLTFDAYTMKQYIVDRLNESGVFTDQNFEGSYISTINNIIAYTFNSLMYYLNKTSSESIFSEAQVYENMNRIVKMLSYKPIGFQSATLPFTPTVGALTPGLYYIPRYSYFTKNSISYSFAEDIIFEKTVSGTEVLTDLANQKLLFQGRFREYSNITVSGEDNEIINLSTPEAVNVDHFNIQVYVKRYNTGIWEEWKQTENLYLELPSALKYEVRLNENKNYELKFGNDINGSKLQENDTIAIYYLESSGINGEVGQGFLQGASFVLFGSSQWVEISSDVVETSVTQLPNSSLFTATNSYPSSESKNIETPDNIRENAPGIFRSQLRLVTKDDFRNFLKTNFGNFVHDVHIANNWDFLQGRMQYLYNLGLDNPMSDTPVLYAHSQFADACNFNNIYITALPKTSITSINNAPVLSNSQKQTMMASMRPRKLMTSEIVFLDPVYMAVGIGVSKSNTNPNASDTLNSVLSILRDGKSSRPNNDIKNDIVNIITNEFLISNRSLGDTINITDLTNRILSVGGVKKVYTKRTDTGEKSEGLRMIIYNPIYPQDVSLVTNNTNLLDFQFAFFENISTLASRIEIENTINIYENIEY